MEAGGCPWLLRASDLAVAASVDAHDSAILPATKRHKLDAAKCFGSALDDRKYANVLPL